MAIKICGITRLEDAIYATACGVDALGFIFYPKSPRCITPEHAKSIISRLPRGSVGITASSSVFSASEKVSTVGVFVNEDPDRVMDIATFCGLDLIQLHGDESPAYCGRFPAERLIKAFFLKTEDNLKDMGCFKVRAILIDTYDPVRYGGTGKTSNWALAAQAKALGPLILSGGLHSGNIREAIEAVDPEAVDINSGVEASPGIKDHDKVKALIEKIRSL
ncbi:MAG: N-(5'-phosphoribosyl)anthranilate isomerase [Syntrophus sp. SKADARSKE-3]|nr:N-(5'-phosphoribosyl)anthranilate isomerase [Syntrophus sp. SKADARSKE-3]